PPDRVGEARRPLPPGVLRDRFVQIVEVGRLDAAAVRDHLGRVARVVARQYLEDGVRVLQARVGQRRTVLVGLVRHVELSYEFVSGSKPENSPPRSSVST